MSEPDFIAQTAEPITPLEREEWVRSRLEDSRKQGSTWHRVTVHPEIENLLLLEGWQERPEDEGEARFQLCLSR